MELTYVALKPLRVGGKIRQPGELVPEASEWHNLPAYISSGKLSAVPASMAQTESPDENSNDNASEEVEEQNAPDKELEDKLEELHAGGGWYELPGEDKKVRKDQAREFLVAGGKSEE
jgi:hypothetical protein